MCLNNIKFIVKKNTRKLMDHEDHVINLSNALLLFDTGQRTLLKIINASTYMQLLLYASIKLNKKKKERKNVLHSPNF